MDQNERRVLEGSPLHVRHRRELEDLGSKSGTYLREKRLDALAELSDGDELRLGQTLLTFRIRREGAPTATER